MKSAFHVGEPQISSLSPLLFFLLLFHPPNGLDLVVRIHVLIWRFVNNWNRTQIKDWIKIKCHFKGKQHKKSESHPVQPPPMTTTWCRPLPPRFPPRSRPSCRPKHVQSIYYILNKFVLRIPHTAEGSPINNCVSNLAKFSTFQVVFYVSTLCESHFATSQWR